MRRSCSFRLNLRDLRSIHTVRQRQLLFCRNGAKVFILYGSNGKVTHNALQNMLICHCHCRTEWGWNLFTCNTGATATAASAHVNDCTCYNGIQLITAPLPQPLPHRVNGPLFRSAVVLVKQHFGLDRALCDSPITKR